MNFDAENLFSLLTCECERTSFVLEWHFRPKRNAINFWVPFILSHPNERRHVRRVNNEIERNLCSEEVQQQQFKRRKIKMIGTCRTAIASTFISHRIKSETRIWFILCFCLTYVLRRFRWSKFSIAISNFMRSKAIGTHKVWDECHDSKVRLIRFEMSWSS